MSRADQLLPEGWKPRLGSTVHVEASKDEPSPPHGTWKAVSKAPGAGQWWLLPVDEAARAWAKHWPGQMTTGHISRTGRVLVPVGFRRPRASDLSPDALRRVAGGGR